MNSTIGGPSGPLSTSTTRKVSIARFKKVKEKAEPNTYLLVIKNRLTNKVVMTVAATGIKAARAEARKYVKADKPTLKVTITKAIESRFVVANPDAGRKVS